jgi:hypothetical protein
VTDDGDTFRVPSVTTICGVIDKSGPLVGWAVKEALKVCEGAVLPGEAYSETYLTQVWQQAKRAHRDTKAAAAAIGTQAHDWIERYLRGSIAEEADGTLPPQPEDDRVLNSVNAALEWLHSNSVKVVEIERKCYSRLWRYSGTTDMLAYVNGQLCICDWKTSTGVYPEFLLQTAAYVAAMEEENPDLNIEGRWLIRLGKEDGQFEAHNYDAGTEDFLAFLNAKLLLDRLEQLK